MSRGSRSRAPTRRRNAAARASARRRLPLKGFLKSAGLTDIGQAHIVKDEKKGEFYAARIEKPGEATIAAIAEIVPSVVASFPWPKSMRFGPQSRAHGFAALGAPAALHPVHIRPRDRGSRRSCISTIGGIASGDVTFGHRVMGPKTPIRGAPLRRLRGEPREGEGHARRRAGAATSSRMRRETSASRQASSSSRMRPCSRRSPASSNGRSC